MISASNAEAHRFGRVRRNGYDPTEVDAAMSRLVDALRRNDERICRLMDTADTADSSARASHEIHDPTAIERDSILAEAQDEATKITEQARGEATDLVAIAEQLQVEVAQTREQMLQCVYKEAEQAFAELERETVERLTEVEWAVQEATSIRDRRILESEADAEAAARNADIEAAEIRSRIATMSQAALGLEHAAQALANTALDGAKVIDLRAMDELTRFRVAAVAASEEPTSKDEPTLTVALADEDAEDVRAEPRTRYQQSTGIPLKERIKIARMSG